VMAKRLVLDQLGLQVRGSALPNVAPGAHGRGRAGRSR
jgi:hypothetical protein